MRVELMMWGKEEIKEGSYIELPDHIFGLEVRRDIIHRMVLYQLAKRQAGTHSTKTRAEVSMTGRKFVKQKGSGGARHGSRKVSQFRTGGVAFGPRVHSHAFGLTKKLRALALRHALSSCASQGMLTVVDIDDAVGRDSFLKTSDFKKNILPSLTSMNTKEKKSDASKQSKDVHAPKDDAMPSHGHRFSLLIDGNETLNVGLVRAMRNLEAIRFLSYEGLNVYDLMRCGRVILTHSALKRLEVRFS